MLRKTFDENSPIHSGNTVRNIEDANLEQATPLLGPDTHVISDEAVLKETSTLDQIGHSQRFQVRRLNPLDNIVVALNFSESQFDSSLQSSPEGFAEFAKFMQGKLVDTYSWQPSNR